MNILVCNAGSTSLKFKLFEFPAGSVLATGKVERVGSNDAIYHFDSDEKHIKADGQSVANYMVGVKRFMDDLGEKLSLIKRPIYFVGDGAVLCYNRFKDTLSDIHLPSENIRFQRASSLAKAVFDNKLYDDDLTPEKLTVSYLRLSQAERERKAKLEVKGNDGTCV